ncbi:MAG: c-type cytochrome [Gemmataceae bacterium]
MSDLEWYARLSSSGDVEAGRRVFFHPGGPGCFRCHRVDGFGENVGPDLSTIGDALSGGRLIESILQPSKEVAPRFTTWRIVTDDGKVRVGAITDEGAHSVITLADSDGKLHRIARHTIEERSAVPTSIMPDKLADRMTPREFTDLIAYLQSRRTQPK